MLFLNNASILGELFLFTKGSWYGFELVLGNNSWSVCNILLSLACSKLVWNSTIVRNEGEQT